MRTTDRSKHNFRLLLIVLSVVVALMAGSLFSQFFSSMTGRMLVMVITVACVLIGMYVQQHLLDRRINQMLGAFRNIQSGEKIVDVFGKLEGGVPELESALRSISDSFKAHSKTVTVIAQDIKVPLAVVDQSLNELLVQNEVLTAEQREELLKNIQKHFKVIVELSDDLNKAGE